jgi:2-polyprenyl-6-methoxyphenol hydroxylase-like FAD-dependent oxidoreductase
MKPNQRTEVLIVGAGPVGMFTALLLGRNGVHTKLIDQEQNAAGRSYACALHPHSIQLLDHVGIASEAVSLGWPVYTVRFYDGKTPRLEVPLSDLSTDFPFVLVIRQSQLEQFLQDRIKELLNVRLDWNQRLQHLRTEDTGISSTIEELQYTAKGYISPEFEKVVGNEASLRTDFVIGADGRDSIVRQRAGIDLETTGASQHFEVFEFETDASMDQELKVVLEPDAMSVMWPLGPNHCRWSFQVPNPGPPQDFPNKERNDFIIRESDSPENSPHRLHAFLQKRAPWFESSIKEVAWSASATFSRGLATGFGRGRCWLAGDAAHQTSPAGMQSMNYGLSEGADLAGALSRILRHDGSFSLLDNYNLHHRSEWQRLFHVQGDPKSAAHASPWVIANRARILDCLPVSGREMTQLLRHIGLEIN